MSEALAGAIRDLRAAVALANQALRAVEALEAAQAKQVEPKPRTKPIRYLGDTEPPKEG